MFLYKTMFDIVILVGPNDIDNIETQLAHCRRNIIGFRQIYIICYDPTVSIDGCIMVQESKFPFRMSDVAEVFARYDGKNNRNGWYYQQLLKLYCGFVIADLLDQFLIVDADVYFLKPIEFISRHANGRALFNISDNYDVHRPYFTHMEKMHPEFKKHVAGSGICHHMMFHKTYVKEMFDMVERHHHSMPFWKIFLEMVEEHVKYPAYAIESGASEYEMYLNFMIYYHSDVISIRKLKWEDKPKSFFDELKSTEGSTIHPSVDYISICHWM